MNTKHIAVVHPNRKEEMASMFLRRLDSLEKRINELMNSIYHFCLAMPPVAIGLATLARGLTKNSSFDRDTASIIYVGLSALALLVVVYTGGLMREVFALGGIREAVEKVAVEKKILPPGLFAWESCAVVEVHGIRNLEGKLNIQALSLPVVGGFAVLSLLFYSLFSLRELGECSYLYVAVGISVLTSVIAGLSSIGIWRCRGRVMSRTSNDLRSVGALDP